MTALVPSDMRDSIKDLEFEASRLIALRNYKKAEELYDKIFTQIFDRQFIEKRRIHLGAPLHMKGITLLFQNKFNEAILNFILAYITDTVNCPLGEENNADQSPAHNILKRYYNISEDIFNIIKTQSKNIYHNRTPPFNPETILKPVLERLEINKDKLISIAGRIPDKAEVNKLIFQFFNISIFDLSTDRTKLNHNKLNKVVNRLIEVPSEIKNILPEVLSKSEVNIMNILTDDYYLLVFLDHDGWLKTSEYYSKKKPLFPGLIKTDESEIKANIKIENSKNMFLDKIHTINNYAFSLGKDSTLLLNNHTLTSTIDALGIYDYKIDLAYLITFGDEIIVDNFYDYLEDLIAYSFKIWRS